MSHAFGQVRFSDGLILHFEYNGTTDICQSRLRLTAQEVLINWRGWNEAECHCSRNSNVEIATNYGGGFSWTGRACRHCMAIITGRLPFEEAETIIVDKLPEWWER